MALTTVSKLSLGQFHEKRRLEAHEMAKKTLLSPQSKVQLVSLVKKYKRLTAERGRDDYLFLDNMPKTCFRLPKLKKMILFGGRSGSCVPGDKKLIVAHMGL